jgi:hypothetical protein
MSTSAFTRFGIECLHDLVRVANRRVRCARIQEITSTRCSPDGYAQEAIMNLGPAMPSAQGWDGADLSGSEGMWELRWLWERALSQHTQMWDDMARALGILRALRAMGPTGRVEHDRVSEAGCLLLAEIEGRGARGRR